MTTTHYLAPLLTALDRIQALAEQAKSAGQPPTAELLSLAADALVVSTNLLATGNGQECLRLTSRIKALSLPLSGLDLLRGQAFLSIGQTAAACAALTEELRYFPDNVEASRLLNDLAAPTTIAQQLKGITEIYPQRIPKFDAPISRPSTAPIVEGTLTESIYALKGMIASHPRRQPGHVIIEGIRFSFADLHSFFFELEQIFSKHLYGFHTQEDHPLIIDCGAHVGLATLYFARRYPQSIIHAFEADPDIHNIFCANVLSSELDNVTSHAKAVWIHDDGVHFRLSGDDSGHISQGVGTQIPSIRLKSYLEQFARIDMLKLDVEGAEYEILKDCSSVLSRVQRMIIEVHHLSNEKHRLAVIFSVLEQAGFLYVVSDLHSATWTKSDTPPPFDFISHDKFIMTVFAWHSDSSQNDYNSKKSKSPQRSIIAQFCMQDYGGAETAAVRLHEGLLNLYLTT